MFGSDIIVFVGGSLHGKTITFSDEGRLLEWVEKPARGEWPLNEEYYFLSSVRYQGVEYWYYMLNMKDEKNESEKETIKGRISH